MIREPTVFLHGCGMLRHSGHKNGGNMRISGLVKAAVLVTCGTMAHAGAEGAEQAGFVEEFERLDPARWFISDGWTNGPHQSCTWSRKAVATQGGVLRLSLTQGAGGTQDLLCGEVQTVERFGYGVYEASVRVPFAAGTNSNFFTYIGPVHKEAHNEIDFEFIARTRPTLQTNTYVDGTGGNERLVPVRNATQWHDIAFIWEPGRLRWFVDGEQIRVLEGDAVPDTAQKIYLSIWSTSVLTEWMGNFTWERPLVFQVERVAFSPLGTSCPFAGSVLCNAELVGTITPVKNVP